MAGFIKKYFGYYYLLFFFSYISIFFIPAVTPAINILILIASYYLIIKRRRFDVILILILYSRCLNGFIIPHHKLSYIVINLLTNVVPALLYFFHSALIEKNWKKKLLTLYKYKFTILFFLFLTISFFLNFSTSYDLITKRYLPFLFFMLFLFFFTSVKDIRVYGLLRFFRVTFFGAIIAYFFSNYIHIMQTNMESDSVFSVASPPHSFSLVYFNFTRNMGFFWDHRVLAIFSYLYLLLAVIYKPKYFNLDIILSFIVVITTTSRGGIITYGFILLAYLLQAYRLRFVLLFIFFAIMFTVFSFYAKDILPPSTYYFLKSFSPNSDYNAISQRHFFSDYALNAFSFHPIWGNGVGFLSSHTIDRNLIVDGNEVPAVGDAYWYVLLAEMGIVGFILCLFFLFEVFYSGRILSLALLLGFSIQLLGTDIPDMRFYFFGILVLVYIATNQIRAKPKTVKAVS